MIFSLYTNAQTQESRFSISDPIADGPFLEVTENGHNVYTWVSRSGFQAKKLGGLTHGAEPVQVIILNVQSFNSDGNLTSEESFPVKLESFGGGLGKYVVTDKRIGGTAFAQAEDPTEEELLNRFPNSTRHSGKNAAQIEKQLQTIARLNGQGLLGWKKPYELNVIRPKDKTSTTDAGLKGLFASLDAGETVTLADIPAGESNAEWKTSSGKAVFENGQVLVYPTIYSKWVKKDKTRKLNHFQEYKFVTYNESGKMLEERDLTFDKPYLVHSKMDVVGSKGKMAGKLITFKDRGGKKTNTNFTKMHFMQFDENVKMMKDFEHDFSSSLKVSKLPSIMACFKAGDAVNMFTFNEGNKKEGLEKAISQFKIIDGSCNLVSVLDWSKLVVNTPGIKKFGSANNIKGFETQIDLKNGDMFYVGREVVTGSTTSYGNAYYMRVSQEGNLRNVGILDRGSNFSAAEPFFKLENLDADRTMITISTHGTKEFIWIYNVKENNFKQVVADVEMQVVGSVRRGNDMYYIGAVNKETGDYSVVKKPL